MTGVFGEDLGLWGWVGGFEKDCGNEPWCHDRT